MPIRNSIRNIWARLKAKFDLEKSKKPQEETASYTIPDEFSGQYKFFDGFLESYDAELLTDNANHYSFEFPHVRFFLATPEWLDRNSDRYMFDAIRESLVMAYGGNQLVVTEAEVERAAEDIQEMEHRG